MRNRLVVFLLVGIGLVFCLLVARQMIRSRDLPRGDFTEHKLRVLTYSTFMSTSGPGEEVIKRFEKESGVKVEVVTLSEAGLLLERMKLGEAGVPFDVVVGLDQLLLESARRDYKWRKIVEDRTKWSPEPRAQSDDFFSAFDWSPLTFVYRKDGREVPAHFDEILAAPYKKQWAVQDPHSSTPGLQFFHWVKALKGEGAESWLRQFHDTVYNISPTWSFSYGLFKKGEVRFVFSYLTSLAFHWGDEKDRNYQVLVFPEGHPVQVELVAIPDSCRECDSALSFVKAMHEDWAQILIMKRNYMFPVRAELTKGTVYAELPALKTLATDAGRDVYEWDQVFSN